MGRRQGDWWKTHYGLRWICKSATSYIAAGHVLMLTRGVDKAVGGDLMVIGVDSRLDGSPMGVQSTQMTWKHLRKKRVVMGVA